MNITEIEADIIRSGCSAEITSCYPGKRRIVNCFQLDIITFPAPFVTLKMLCHFKVNNRMCQRICELIIVTLIQLINGANYNSSRGCRAAILCRYRYRIAICLYVACRRTVAEICICITAWIRLIQIVVHLFNPILRS